MYLQAFEIVLKSIIIGMTPLTIYRHPEFISKPNCACNKRYLSNYHRHFYSFRAYCKTSLAITSF